jgi:thioredoxin reductase (NADPH)
VQAQKFGADVAIANSAIRLRCDRKPYVIELSTEHSVRGRTLVIASGAAYRQLAVENLDRFMGVGVYYAATYVEAKLCQKDEVIVVGGGNSAGQAAVFLAQASHHVHVLVRSSGLADSMSRYLIRRIEESPNITLHTHTEIVALHGESNLEKVTWRDASGVEETHAIRHLFLMTGADPNTGWLQNCLALDEKGFVRTGTDIAAQELQERDWPLTRPPHYLETNLPGIFAVGDVRSGSVKRVAAAVGEGSACVQLVHRALHE